MDSSSEKNYRKVILNLPIHFTKRLFEIFVIHCGTIRITMENNTLNCFYTALWWRPK